ncbi:hypothetical protein [Mesorhizobium sp. WSM3626]|uniref:hypothetical protein n=1 Tax=Mesorhizobium sp. WSM3626 TaxID=1040987 RepID=UPI000517DE47|nr:hypothetical protein [Mesorhizobium sp. WSM3626]
MIAEKGRNGDSGWRSGIVAPFGLEPPIKAATARGAYATLTGYTIGRLLLPPLVMFGVLVLSDVTIAANVKLTCGRADVMNPSWAVPITFVYAGDEAGPVTVTGPFGSFSITVRPPGEALDGTDKVRIKLPVRADLEAYIEKSRDPASNSDDNHAFLTARDACLQKLAPAPGGVDVVVGLRIGLFADRDESSGEDAFVDFRLRYDSESGAPDGAMTVEPLSAQCVLER